MADVIAVRPLVAEDVEAAVEIEQDTYPQPWTEGIFRDELAQPHRVYLGAEVAGRLAGYGGLLLAGEDAHITTVVVAPAHRGHGLGTRLMLRLAEAAVGSGARNLTLEVRVSNRRAQALYQRFGMAPVGMRKNYYLDEDALIMWVHDIDQPEYRQRLEAVRERIG